MVPFSLVQTVYRKQDCLLIKGRPPANAGIYLCVVTFGHVTNMVVTPFDLP